MDESGSSSHLRLTLIPRSHNRPNPSVSVLTRKVHVHLLLGITGAVADHHSVLARLGPVRPLELEDKVLLAEHEVVLALRHGVPAPVQELEPHLGLSVLDCDCVGEDELVEAALDRDD